MRCPKCHYLSFDPEPRCKNCGYALISADADLIINSPDDRDRPFADLSLHDTTDAAPLVLPPSSLASPPAPVRTAARPAVERSVTPAPVPPVRPAAPTPPATAELPLFVRGMPAADPDEPLVKVPAEPRAPVSVRRSDTPPARPKASARKLGPLDRDLLEDLQRIEKAERREAAAETRAAQAAAPDDFERAGLAKRLGAAAFDAVFLGGVSTAVLWVTLRWIEVPFADAAVLPIGPTVAFLLLVGFGYLAMFTAAGGQTMGKMLMSIRVVSDEADDAPLHVLSTRQALLRALLTLPSVLAFGAGLLFVFVGDERALHDRLAHTRVVRA